MGLYHRVNTALDRTLMERHSVSVSDFEVLQELYAADRSGTQVRMSELESSVHLSQSALSRLVSRLEAGGLVLRSMCEDDRRSMYVGITPKGSQRFTEARPTQRSTLRDLMTPAPGH